MANLLRILCLEDSTDDYELIIHALKKGSLKVISERVDTKMQFIDALNSFNPDVILSDHSLPNFDSLEALKIKKSSGLNIPFILVTGAVSDEFAVTSLKLGADDYVLKDKLHNLSMVVLNSLKVKEAEKQKQKLSEDLQKRNEDLVKANRDLDTFLYSVSHNLRSPLNSIQGLINLCEDETDHTKMKVYHEMMAKSIKKLDQNLVEVLEYARSSKQKRVVQQIDFTEVLNENLEKMKFMEDAEFLQSEISIDGEAPFYSDSFRLSSVVNNLVSNAIKYQDRSKPCRFIKIHVAVTAEQALIRFEDNGIGIQQEHVEKVFDMFFRATDVKSGVGLGLHIVKEAVEAMEGTIGVRSKEREGTTFEITLPNLERRQA
jgi:signal transduction histidine kinase